MTLYKRRLNGRRQAAPGRVSVQQLQARVATLPATLLIMKYFAVNLASLLIGALAVSASPLTKRQGQEFCGQWDLVETGTFILYNNLWGRDQADSGEQCTTLISSNGNHISWSAAWTWIGDQYSVKSYPNAVLDVAPQPLSSISSIPTSWSWRSVRSIHSSLLLSFHFVGSCSLPASCSELTTTTTDKTES